MRRFWIFLSFVAFAGILFTSCLEDQYEKEKERADNELQDYLSRHKLSNAPVNGVYITLKDTGEGIKPAVNDYVFYNYTLRLLDESIVETNNMSLAKTEKILPATITTGPMYGSVAYLPQGFCNSLSVLKEGDSAKVIIPQDLFYGQYSSYNIPSFSNVIFEVRLLKVIKDPKAYDRAFINQKVADSLQMNLADSTAKGNYVKILDPGQTDKGIENYKTVKLKIMNFLIDGRKIGNKVKYDTISYTTGKSDNTPGFEDLILSMKLKQKSKVIIPYYNAFGEGGLRDSYGIIVFPMATSLYYYMEVLEIK